MVDIMDTGVNTGVNGYNGYGSECGSNGYGSEWWI